MIIKNITTASYRNLLQQRVDFASEINIFVGGNGQGKTNLLEAVYLLSTLRSFRGASTKNVIYHQAESAQIIGQVVATGVPSEIKIIIDRKGRRVWVGRRCVRNALEFLGMFKVIAFTPDDLAMVKGAPSVRRRFLDGSVFLFLPSHLQALKEFNTALAAYNRLLKSERLDRDVINSFGQAMACSGAEISVSRRQFIEKIAGRVEKIMSRLSGKACKFTVVFKPGWRMEDGSDPSRLSDGLYEQLCKDFHINKSRGYSIHGPQQDDFEILIDSKPMRWFGSQGQQKACAISLLLGVVNESIEQGYDIPVILLDDISSELDSHHRGELFDLVSSIGGQVFITATEENLISNLVKKAARVFHLKEGHVQVKSN